MCFGFSCTGDGGLDNLSYDDDDDDSPELSEINTAIYEKMSQVYFWRDSLESISNTNTNASTQSYFDDEIRYRVNTSVDYSDDTYGDRFSYIDEDTDGDGSAKLYTRSSTAISGDPIADWGFEFVIWLDYTGSDVLFLQVLYVIPDSPASTAGLKRGDYISAIDGSSLTLTNIYSLLSDNEVTLTLVNKYSVEQGTLTLTYAEFDDTPLIYSGIIEGSSPTTGYFFYTEFTDETTHLLALKEMFAEFRAGGVENVIVDLRYNPGGYISTAQLISSALTPNQSDLGTTVMFQTQSNASLSSLTGYTYYSSDQIGGITNHVAPTKLAFIMTGYSASASELTYNSLRTLYADSDCIFVGETTVGKNLGSNSYTVNDWTLHPITARIYNKDGISGYEEGFDPDTEVVDIDPYNVDIEEIGNTNERMLSATLAQLGVTISGIRASYEPSIKTKAQALYELKPVFSTRVEYPAVILDK